MKISEILSRKGGQVVAVSPDSSVTTAIRLLVNHGIGSVVVKEGDEVVGILTERDILRMVDRNTDALTEATVSSAMTRDLIVALPSDDVGYVMEVLTKNRIRHLPVMEAGEIRGIISIGDVVNALRREVETENRYLRDYVQGMVS
ncbi:MAG: CBS domain-containing protein [Gemmatimonadales bacterium]|nr:MAG: CBS domain-containing protein [Gemmatimonadales bacterium]